MNRSAPLIALTTGLALTAACADEGTAPFRFESDLPAALPAACVGEAYLFAIEVFDGRDRPISWAAHGLPPGLEFESREGRGRLEGVPTEAGTYLVTLEVTAGDEWLSASLTLIVATPLQIVTTAVEAAVLGQPYEAWLEASGGDRRVWAGQGAPAGLSLSAEGRLGGLPEEAGRFELEVRVTDPVSGKQASGRLSLEVLDRRPFRIVSELIDPVSGVLELPVGVVGRAYEQPISAEGGSDPLSWTWVGLPPGLTVGPSGRVSAVSGTPTHPGTYAGTAEVTDVEGERATIPFEILVVEPLRIDTDPLGTIPRCWQIAHPLLATGGSGEGHTWSVVLGTLPAWIELRPSGSTAQLAGLTSITPESVSFVVEVRDSLGLTARADFEVVVSQTTDPRGERYLAFTGMLEVAESGLFVLDRCGPAASGDPVRVNPTDVRSSNLTPGAVGLSFGMEIDRGGDKIAFVGDDANASASSAVYLADLRQGPRLRSGQPVLGELSGVVRPQFSPDGAWLAIHQEDVEGLTASLWLVDVTDPSAPGTAQLVASSLPANALVEPSLRFSPDGSRLAYLADGDFLARLFIRDLTRPQIGPPVAAHPSAAGTDGVLDFVWTRDGRGLIYMGRFDGELSIEPFFCDLSAPQPYARRRVLDPVQSRSRGFESFSLVWQRFALSPSGDRLYLAGVRTLGGVQELLVVPYADGGFGVPTRAAEMPNRQTQIIHASWSPTGDRIAFAQTESGELALHVVNVRGAHSGSPPIRLSNTLQGRNVASGLRGDHGWMCGGEVLVFLSDQAEDGLAQLYAADLDATRVEAIPLGPAPIVAPGVTSFTISPNGRHVAFLQTTRDRRAEGFVVEDICTRRPAPARLHAPFTDDDLSAWWTSGRASALSAFWTADSRSLYMLGAHRRSGGTPRGELFVTTLPAAELRGAPLVATTVVEADPTLSGGSLLHLTIEGVNPLDGR